MAFDSLSRGGTPVDGVGILGRSAAIVRVGVAARDGCEPGVRVGRWPRRGR